MLVGKRWLAPGTSERGAQAGPRQYGGSYSRRGHHPGGCQREQEEELPDERNPGQGYRRNPHGEQDDQALGSGAVWRHDYRVPLGHSPCQI